MRRKGFLIVMSIFLMSSVCVYAEDIELSKLNSGELSELAKKAHDAIEKYHEPDSNEKDKVLSVVETSVEEFAENAGVDDVSWAWFDYEYTRDWDFYTLDTHADFDDEENDIYAELFPENGDYTVYYLLIGKEVIINRREELPENLWTEEPESMKDEVSGLELSIMTEEQLLDLIENIDDEMSEYHKPKSDVKDTVLDITKEKVEEYYAKKDLEVSWAWFDYTYTREWDLYMLATSVEYENDNDSGEADVYAEAYPMTGEYELVYLTVGEEVLIDNREELPEDIAGIERDEIEDVVETETESRLEIEDETRAELREKDVEENQSEIKEFPVLYEVGSVGEEVKIIQEKLIELGYLSGTADGQFGKMTKSAIETLQINEGLKVTGVITEKEMNIILPEGFPDYEEQNTGETSGTLTVENCPELQDILLKSSEFDPSYGEFASKYSGRTIKFDGYVASLVHHGDYKTRYDVLIYYDNPDGVTGPYFRFTDVNVYDMNITTDSIKANDKVIVEAEVKSYEENTGFFQLKPVKVTVK